MCAGPATNLLILPFSFHPTRTRQGRRRPARRAPDAGRQRRSRGSPMRYIFLLPSSPLSLSCSGRAMAFIPRDGDLSGGGSPVPITLATPAAPAPAMVRRRPQRRRLPLPHHAGDPGSPRPHAGDLGGGGLSSPPRRRYR
jgi:hypothetical protein